MLLTLKDITSVDLLFGKLTDRVELTRRYTDFDIYSQVEEFTIDEIN